MFEKRERKTTVDLYEALQESVSAAMDLIDSPDLDPNFRDGDGDSILYAACCWDNPSIVQALLSAGSDPNVVGVSGSPLYIAAGLGNRAIVKALLEYGANINKGKSNDTPLNVAIKRRQYEVASFLVDRGADPNISCGVMEETPLMGAAFHGEGSLVAELIQAGADVAQEDKDGDTALAYFALGRSLKTEVAIILLQNGGDINDLYSHGCVFVELDVNGMMVHYPRERVDVCALHYGEVCVAALRPGTPIHQELCY